MFEHASDPWFAASAASWLFDGFSAKGILQQAVGASVGAAVGYALRVAWERLAGDPDAREVDLKRRAKLLEEREAELEHFKANLTGVLREHDRLLRDHIRCRAQLSSLGQVTPPTKPEADPSFHEAAADLQVTALHAQLQIARLQDENGLLRRRIAVARSEAAELHSIVRRQQQDQQMQT